MRRRCALAALSLATWIVLGPAHADDAAEARFHAAAARRAYAARRFEEALDHFLLAHEAAPSASTLYNAALAADLSGSAGLAYEFFDEFLALPGQSAALRQDAEQRRQRLSSRLALVRIESEPAGAAIVVDRPELGDFGVTPRTLALPAGTHQVTLSLPGWRAALASVQARVGQLDSVRAVLAPVVGTLRLEAVPHEGHVVVRRDGRAVAEGAATDVLTVPAGPCLVRLDAPGHEPAEAWVEVRADEEATVQLEAAPLPPPVGRLLVEATPPADVRVDGALRGRTPLVLGREPVGRHRVELLREGAVRWAASVEIRRGRSAFVTVRLPEAP